MILIYKSEIFRFFQHISQNNSVGILNHCVRYLYHIHNIYSTSRESA